MKLNKTIFIIIILLLLFGSGLFYLNQSLLPRQIKTILIKAIQENTNIQAELGSVSLNIFKGLVLRDISLTKDEERLIYIKEADCAFLILPLISKKIIIPRVKVKEADIFLKRHQDGSFNLSTTLFKKNTDSKSKFSIFIYSVGIFKSSLSFQDDTLSPAFIKKIDNLNLGLWLSLPLAVKYNLSFSVSSGTPIKVNSKGEFKIKEKSLSAKTSVKDLSLKEFYPYYQKSGISFPLGLSELILNTVVKENTLNAHLEVKSRGLVIASGNTNSVLDAQINSDFKYGIFDKKLYFSGNADIANLDISGLDKVEDIRKIKGKVKFDNSGISAERISALIWQVPVEGKLSIKDFLKPHLLLEISLAADLAYLHKIIADKFGLQVPVQIKGSGNLNLKLEKILNEQTPFDIAGSLDIASAEVTHSKIDNPIEDISGHLEFKQDSLSWGDINFRYLDKIYKTKGALNNFKAPAIETRLSSENLVLETSLTVIDQLINILQCKGRYFNTDFYLKGRIGAINLPNPEAILDGSVELELADLKDIFAKAKDKLEPLKLSGLVNAELHLEGNLSEFKSCLIQAKLYSDSISAYGLKSGKMLFDYTQVDGIADIPFMQMYFYGGSIQMNAKMNFNSERLPYFVNFNMQDVKIEKLKLDTPAKDKNITGIMQGELKLNGFSSDLAKMTGAGKVIITEGNLWQLNLFKGLGQVVFIKDFSNISFSEASCGFLIQDKFIITEDLKMRSTLANLEGPAKIGFDGSIDATLNVSVGEDVPLTGTFKDVTTAIMGEAGRFGVIKISGTLKDPKYKFKASVTDIIKGLKDTFLKSE